MQQFSANYDLNEKTHLHELQCDVIELTHKKTGAKILHIENDDDENLFSLSFRSYPKTSNGVAHILEHTVLCGSEKYPIKDPFFAMNRRSLNTFMNAFTGSDFTGYPAATQVPKDFYNLLAVYLDAVFYPNLKQLSFLQEGWRLALDEESNLKYQGVVYNEMKGALSNPMSRLHEAIHGSLFPDLTYGINSGGDPKVIPELTHEKLLEFHKTYYHPSRCLFFFYGNMPLKKHLDFIEEHVLDRSEKEEDLKPLPTQPRFSSPVKKSVPYPISPDESDQEKTMIALSWLTCSILEQQELLALQVLDSLLMDTDTSPLKQALLKSGLCQEANAFIEADMSEAPFVLMLRGCKKDAAEEVDGFVELALQKICKEGIDPKLIDNALHQMEFHRSEITGDGAPFGLTLYFRAALLKQHGGKPCDALQIHALFDELRGALKKNPRYLEDLIEKYLLKNSHKSIVTAFPSTTLIQEERNEELTKLKKLKDILSEEQIDSISSQQKELEIFQQKQECEDLDVLPKLTLADVPKESKNYSLSCEKHDAIKVYHHTTFTNDIVYADLAIAMPSVAREKLSYVRLLAAILTELPCGERTLEETQSLMHGTTGGVGVALSTNIQAKDANTFYPKIHLRGKALGRNLGSLFTLVKDFISSPDFSDVKRLKELLLKHFTALESSFTNRALKYALSLSSSALTPSATLSESWFGLEYFLFVRKIVQNLDKEALSLQKSLIDLHSSLFRSKDADLILTCSKERYDEIKKQSFFGLGKLEGTVETSWAFPFERQNSSAQGRIIGSSVAFIGQALPAPSYTHPKAPALALASCLMDRLVLHPKIREQGGAYGSGANHRPLSALFTFYSYRDPHISGTLATFKETLEVIVKGEFDQQALEEAKLEIIQDLDSPVAPGSRGEIAYTWLQEGLTLELRQTYRDQLLDTTKADVQKVVEEELIPKYLHSVTTVFAGKELFDGEKGNLPFEKALKV